MNYAMGADIGGTTVKLGIFTVDGTLKRKWEIPTRTQNHGKQILSDIASSCKEMLKELGLSLSEFSGIGIGVPGSVSDNGFVDVCVNLGWKDMDVKSEMEGLLGLPVRAGNDANVAALGEMWQGGGKGYKDVVMVTLGTGVGGGIIVDGKIVTGAHGYGGEIGHIMINPHEEEFCNCGKRGCLEQYCSATGIVRMTKKALEQYEGETKLFSINLTAKDIFDEAKRGDDFACRQVESFSARLARGLSFISCVTDPEIFVIGGGVSKAGRIIIDSVQKKFCDFTYGKQKNTKFALALLGNDAGIYGCAKLVLYTKEE